MTWTIKNRFPTWGEEGEFPPDGFFYSGGDQVNEKHLDALWYNIEQLETETRSALTDIDSNNDGVVDKADSSKETESIIANGNLKGDLVAADGEIVWDESNTYIPQSRLEKDSVTINATDSLTGGGSVSLGGSKTIGLDETTIDHNNLSNRNHQGDNLSPNSVNANTVETPKLSIPKGLSVRGPNGWHWGFDGNDPDDRLDNALDIVGDGFTIYLEAAEYTKDRQIGAGQKGATFVGTSAVYANSNDTVINANWDIYQGAIKQARIAGEITFTGGSSKVMDLRSVGDITIGTNKCIIYGISGGTVTFESGTSGGIIDTCTGVSVVDNGNNKIGDI
jgi:hypothetical protein